LTTATSVTSYRSKFVGMWLWYATLCLNK
jgi:hypothetical protein